MANGSNFFSNLISQLFGGNTAETIKKKQLKSISKDLSRTKFHFYKYATNTADPSLAKFFYEIYKAIAPAQAMLTNATPNILKNMVLSGSVSDEGKAILEGLSEASLKNLAANMPIKDLQKKVKQELDIFMSDFTNTKIRSVDNLYRRIILFDAFCKYDFYFLLKKFNNKIRERNFDVAPSFNPVSGTYIAEDLKNFIAVAWALPLDNSWDEVFAMFKKMRGVEPIQANTWKKVVSRLRTLKDRRVLEMMVQLITENPSYREVIKQDETQIMAEYLGQIRHQVEDTLSKLKEAQSTGKIDSLVAAVFDGADVSELTYYNSEGSDAFTEKGFEGFLYCEPLKYLMKFLSAYSKHELKDLSDIILVRGEWATQQMSVPMSNAYHEIIDITAKVKELDEMVAEDGEYGLKLKNYMPRAERDRDARGIIKTVLGDLNDEAGNLILEASKSFVVYARNLKMVIEDFAKAPHSAVIVNWKELDHFAEGKFRDMAVSAYKKLYNFVNLMQCYQVRVNEKSRR